MTEPIGADGRTRYQRYYWRHRERILARNRQPDRVEAARLRSHEWYLAHKEEVIRKSRERRLADPARHRQYIRASHYRHVKKRSAYVKAYRKANPEWFRVWNRNLKLRRRAVPGRHTLKDIRHLYAKQRGRCFYCGVELHNQFQVDHQTPVSRGGSNDPENLCCACSACNQAKRAMTAEEFLAVRLRAG